MEARLLRLALALKNRERPGRSRAAQESDDGLGGDLLTKAERMAAFLALHYTNPLSVADVGRHVGLHPNHAMTLFKRAFGTPLVTHLIQHRISHAQRLLVTTDEKILDVALDAGFGSVSRFNAAFRRVCGCSPRQYRRRHSQWRGGASGAGGEGDARPQAAGALTRFFKPENDFAVREALLKVRRADLIGSGYDAPLPARLPKEAIEARRRANDPDHYHTVANPAKGEKPGERALPTQGYRPKRATQPRRQDKKGRVQ
jgi:AraC-like DNA-binding protein